MSFTKVSVFLDIQSFPFDWFLGKGKGTGNPHIYIPFKEFRIFLAVFNDNSVRWGGLRHSHSPHSELDG